MVENSIETATPRETNKASNQSTSYKYLMSFKNSKSNDQLQTTHQLESSLGKNISSKNVSIGPDVALSSIGSKQQLPLQIETSSPSTAVKLQSNILSNVHTTITNKT
jgi:hypothetical protein